VKPTGPPGWFFVALVAMQALHFMAPGPHWLAFPWTLLGLLPLGLGVALHAWALSAFARSGTTPDPKGRASVLVRSGPYARSRNPMYLAGFPILAGVALLLGTTTPLLVLPLYAVAAVRWVAREEARLTERFGAEWDRYRGTVRRWL
jgi:protein-S-isoprenylcysteine O-methyltransferase Ste14